MNKIIGAFTFNDEVHLVTLQIETMLRFCDEIVALSDNPNHETFNIVSSYVGPNFHLFYNDKTDRFAQRDEQGDRARLLKSAKEFGATTYYYTDVDEIIEMTSVNNMRAALEELPNNHILNLRRYDLWKNAYNYRLIRDTSNGGKIFKEIESPYTTKYACKLDFALDFDPAEIPNFHAKRMPNFNTTMVDIIDETIKVIHYGYFNEKLIESKKQFYLINSNTSKVNWEENMQVSSEEYINKWGAGYLIRKSFV
jgi:hypothetical protein